MSKTFTVLEDYPWLFWLSMTVYVTVYDPGVFVSTALVAVIFADISPSRLSIAVALASVYVAPWFTETGLLPKIVITGASVSNTFTVLTTVDAALPAESSTSYVTVYAPAPDVFTLLTVTI